MIFVPDWPTHDQIEASYTVEVQNPWLRVGLIQAVYSKEH